MRSSKGNFRVYPLQFGVNPYTDDVSTINKRKKVELLIISLAFSVVAIVAQFGDFMSRRAAANAIGA